MTRESATDIDRAAAQWAAKVDRGLSRAEQTDFDTWLAEDVRRPGAYGRVRAVALHTQRAAALGPAFAPQDVQPARPREGRSRRAVLWGGAGVAASVVGALGWLGASLFGRTQRFQTRKGEIRQIALDDGSVITLNTASGVAVDFDASRRGVRLIDGEAMFDVAHDPKRPFVVSAGAALVRAIGTSFTVSRLADKPIQVVVREGVVEMSQVSEKTVAPVRLAANTRGLAPLLSGAAPIVVTPMRTSEVRDQLAWRDGRIAFEGQTLGDAALQFGRYSETRILIDDPALAREEVAGLYQADDPVGFAQAVALSLGARTQVEAGAVRILR